MKNAVLEKWASIQTAINSYHDLNAIIDFDWWEQQIQEINNEVPNNLFFALDDQDKKNCQLLDHYIHMVRSKILAKQYRQLRSKLNSKDCIGTLFEIILLGILLDNTKQDCIKIFDRIERKSNINECSIKIHDRWISIEASSMKMYEQDLRKLNEIAVGTEKNGFSTGSFWAHTPLDEAKRLRSKFEDKFSQLTNNMPNVIFFLNMTNLYGNLIVDYCFNKMDWCPPELSRVYFFTTKGLLKKYDNILSSYQLTENEMQYLDRIADLLPLSMYFK